MTSNGVFRGFRNLDRDNGTISRVMESLRLFDHVSEWGPGIIGLAVAGRDYTDLRLIDLANRVPEGSGLWMFSPTSRNVSHPSLKLTHVPAATDREFSLKIADHLQRHINRGRGNHENSSVRRLDYSRGEPFSPTRLFPATGSISSGNSALEYACDLVSSEPNSLIVDFGNGATSLQSGDSDIWLPKVGMRLAAPRHLEKHEKVAWWSGAEATQIQSAAAAANSAARALKVPSYRVVFTGINFGGYLALSAASMLRNSKAVVDNSLFDVRWGATTAESVKGLAQAGASSNKVQRRVETDMLMDRFVKLERVPEFVIAQNQEDDRAMDERFMPFKEGFAELSGVDEKHRFVTYSQRHLVLGGRFPLKHSARKRLIADLLSRRAIPERLDKAYITG